MSISNSFHKISADYFQSMADVGTSIVRGTAKIGTYFGKKSPVNNAIDIKISRIALGVLAILSALTLIIPAIFAIGYFICKPATANKIEIQKDKIITPKNTSETDIPNIKAKDQINPPQQDASTGLYYNALRGKNNVPSNSLIQAASVEAKPIEDSAPLDVEERIRDWSREKQDAFQRRLREVLSARLGNKLDDKVNRPSGTTIVFEGKRAGMILTSLKKAFLDTPFFDEVINFKVNIQTLIEEHSYTYTLEELRRTHKWKKNICTSTPHLDPLIQDALHDVVKADSSYVLGFKLDMAETKKQNELVFAIFEKEGEAEISRILIPESKL